MAIATKTQEIPKARDESKTYIYRTKRNCCLGNEYILHGYLYMYLSSFKKKYDVAVIFCEVRGLWPKKINMGKK